MNINCHYSICFLQERVIEVISERNKRMIAIAVAALAFIGALYLIGRYCFGAVADSKKEPYVIDHKVRELYEEREAKKSTFGISEKNVIDLLHLASENEDVELFNACVAFIGKLKDFGQLRDILIHDGYSFNAVKWQCLILLTTQFPYTSHQAILDDKEISVETIELLKLATHFPRFKITPCFLDNYPSIFFKYINSDSLDILRDLNKKITISGLSLNKDFGSITDSELNKIADCLPSLKQFKINDNGFSTFPKSWEGSLKNIDCKNCSGIIAIKASELIKLDCSNCNNLKEIVAPNLIELNCHVCPLLETLDLPNVEVLDSKRCEKLVSITAPKVIDLNCGFSEMLKSIHSPNATSFQCRACKNLERIHAPSATWIDCCHATRCSSIYAPNATKLDCKDCPELYEVTVKAGCVIIGSLPPHCKLVYV